MERACWIPTVIYADTIQNFDAWLPPVLSHAHPPALIIINTEGMADEYTQPVLVEERVWIVSFWEDSSVYSQVTVEIATGGRKISNVDLIQHSMEVIPDSIKDTTFNETIVNLRALVEEATLNDPIVGKSLQILPQRTEDSFRRCEAGECEAGNLFNDAARWYTKTDIAFQASGGFRGPGWDAGDVKVSNIWAALPFNNNLCTGVMTGVSLFRLFNYSLFYSTFEGQNYELDDRLLQVSGLRISYNLQLDKNNRLVKMELWNQTDQSYSEIDRLGLYSFVTDSYVCFGFADYPLLLGNDTLTIQGEKAGSVGDDVIIQSVVSDYLSHLDLPYDPYFPWGRLVNRTDITEPLDMIQTADSCATGDYWEASLASCVQCPTESVVTFLSDRLEFQADESASTKEIKLVNPSNLTVEISMKVKPTWVSTSTVTLESTGTEQTFTGNTRVPVQPGETVVIPIRIHAKKLEPGTAQGSIVLSIRDGGIYPGCPAPDISLEVFARKFPPRNMNQLGNLRYVGITMAILVCLSSLITTTWVFTNRHIQVVRTLQPTFLVTISMGVFIIGLAMIPMSIDDEIASQHVSDMSCMSIPWLMSLGFSFAMSALFAKLWRIERLFRATSFGQRVSVTVKDALPPIAAMLLLNVGVMLAWTITSPLVLQRRSVDDEPWNSYALCRSNNERFGRGMTITVLFINFTCLFLASYMAYTVRNVSDEFSESKRVGLALFCWMQLLLVAGPVLLLIDEDNLSARYFLQTGVIFAVCISMLCFIFFPILLLKRQFSLQRSSRSCRTLIRGKPGSQFTLKESGVRISGLHMPAHSLEPNQQRTGSSTSIGRISSVNRDMIASLNQDLTSLDEDSHRPEEEMMMDSKFTDPENLSVVEEKEMEDDDDDDPPSLDKEVGFSSSHEGPV